MIKLKSITQAVGLWFNSEVLDDARWDEKIVALSLESLATAIKEHFISSANPRKPEVENPEVDVNWTRIASLLRGWMGVEGEGK